MATKQQPLSERIEAIRAEIDAFVDARVAQEAKECPGVPAATLRRSLMRGNPCQCAALLEIKKQDDEAAAREAARKDAA